MPNRVHRSQFDEVLMVAEGDNVTIGAPFVEGGKVTAEVVGHDRHDKIRIIKFRRRKHYMRHAGHRQWYTDVRITGNQRLRSRVHGTQESRRKYP